MNLPALSNLFPPWIKFRNTHGQFRPPPMLLAKLRICSGVKIPWRRRQQLHIKCWYVPTRLHNVISQEISTVTAVKSLNPASMRLFINDEQLLTMALTLTHWSAFFFFFAFEYSFVITKASNYTLSYDTACDVSGWRQTSSRQGTPSVSYRRLRSEGSQL